MFESFLSTQGMNLIGNGWFFYSSAQVVLIIAVVCLVASLYLVIMRYYSAATTVLIISIILGVLGTIVLFGLRANGHNRYERIEDLRSSGWQVLWLDETTDTAGVLIDTHEFKVNMRESDSHWIAYLQCTIAPVNDGTATTVDPSSCLFTPPSHG